MYAIFFPYHRLEIMKKITMIQDIFYNQYSKTSNRKKSSLFLITMEMI